MNSIIQINKTKKKTKTKLTKEDFQTGNDEEVTREYLLTVGNFESF